MEQLENKQSQSQPNCPQNMCISFDKISNTCLKCEQDQDPQQSKNDCSNKKGAIQDEQTIAVVMNILNLLFVSILQYTWINLTQKNKNNFAFSTQKNIKENQVIQSIMTEGSPIQLVVGYPIQQAHANTSQGQNKNAAFESTSENNQKVECQQMNYEQPLFSLEAQSISLSPQIPPQQAIQQNQLPLNILANQYRNQRLQQNIVQSSYFQQNNRVASNHLQIPQNQQFKHYSYKLTQAGNYSFRNFSNNHRIRHVIINLLTLQFVFSKILVQVKNHDNQNTSNVMNNYLIVEFIIGMVIYWFLTFLLPFAIKIMDFVCCNKHLINCRCGSIFIVILFELIAIILAVLITLDVLKFNTYQSQIWFIFWFTGIMLIIIIDEKAVKNIKNKPNSFLAKCIQFRKINFDENKVEQP
ncbi:hypothetical protein ABPG74_019765 [Tetrahymena malaccensis]